MYAIIRAGGKQAKVRSGDVIEVERVKNAGDTVEFQPILVVDDEGATHSDSGDLANAVVTAKVLGEVKGDKVDIFKYKNKTGYRRHMGHRQTFTQLEITGIEMKKTAKKAAAKKTTKSKTETAATAEGAASEEE
jgi:large subunit ribosomal protein L21